jgi:hypothetical protein
MGKLCDGSYLCKLMGQFLCLMALLRRIVAPFELDVQHCRREREHNLHRLREALTQPDSDCGSASSNVDLGPPDANEMLYRCSPVQVVIRKSRLTPARGRGTSKLALNFGQGVLLEVQPKTVGS